MAHTIAELYPYIRVELPGIPEPLLVGAVNQTISEFLSKSEMWRYTTPGLLDWTTALGFPALGAGAQLPPNGRLVRVDSVKFADDGVSLRTVPFKTRQQLDEIYSDWEVKTGNAPLYWTNDGPGNPRIIPIADADVTGSLKVRSVVSILTDSPPTALDDWLMHEFEEDFRHGTLARLMKIPGKDWTDLKGASAYALLFKAAIRKAKSRADAEFGQPCRETSYGGL